MPPLSLQIPGSQRSNLRAVPDCIPVTDPRIDVVPFILREDVVFEVSVLVTVEDAVADLRTAHKDT